MYYYGCNDLFTRHPEVIKRICVSAPLLLDTLLDGLVWRSRQTKEGGALPKSLRLRQEFVSKNGTSSSSCGVVKAFFRQLLPICTFILSQPCSSWKRFCSETARWPAWRLKYLQGPQLQSLVSKIVRHAESELLCEALDPGGKRKNQT